MVDHVRVNVEVQRLEEVPELERYKRLLVENYGKSSASGVSEDATRQALEDLGYIGKD